MIGLVENVNAIRRSTSADLEMITRRCSSVTLVTLAPECMPLDMISDLAAAGIRVALGHSMVTYDQTTAAMAHGLTGFTHLFNAMRPLEAREPGPIAAALESSSAWYGLIVDGIHIAPCSGSRFGARVTLFW
jgi:N-acetylglucosamine-6-phosphate deacetylase